MPGTVTDDFEPRDERGIRFEAAADAVVAGDVRELESLLDADPDLATAASPREHRATLLHYVAANGVEDRRQRVPPNAPEVARLLFARGAVADATCAFGDGGPMTTPLISLVTSTWPHRAGLHAALVDRFVDGGARVDGLDDDAAPLEMALGFGYQAAAQALARRGARVEHVVHAAGLGRLETVRECFGADGALKAEHRDPSGRCQRDLSSLDAAFVSACRHGHVDVARFLHERGADLGAPGDQGFTPLHSAAWYGDGEVLEWLLARGAPLEARNAYGGTVLDGTCWGAANAPAPDVDYPEMVERLCAAGADVRAVDPFPTGIAEIDRILRARGRS